MELNTSDKIVYSMLDQDVQQISDVIVRCYDRVMNIKESELDPLKNYKTSELLDMATCIAVEVEKYEGL